MANITPYNKKNNDVDKKAKEVLDIEKLFESLFNDSFFPTLIGGSSIKVDIMENEREYVVEAELPGVSKEEINVDLKNDKLTISVQRKQEIDETRENYIRRERKSGALSRVFYLPNIKEEEVKARFSNGMLTLNLPKLKETEIKKQRIDIE